MGCQQKTPIIVGVGEVKNRSKRVEDAVEPVDLMLNATMAALQDCGLSPASTQRLHSDIDTISAVGCTTWPYNDLPGLLGERLGVDPKHKSYSGRLGNQPVKMLDDIARRISAGEGAVALLTGGEAVASLNEFAKSGNFPPAEWTAPGREMSSVYSANTIEELDAGLGKIHSIGVPIQVYPLYENGFRAHRGQSIEENHKESASLYGEFAKVAEGHPMSWNYGTKAESENTIGTVSKRNRMICFPYPLLMNAFNSVNLAASCIVTTTDHAESLGIPRSKWIYPLGGAGGQDHENFWQRLNYHSSPAIAKALDGSLTGSGLSREDIELFDFYSCFPIVPKLACQHMSLPIDGSPTRATLLGGLTSFGGAGANYSLHAVSEMVRQLRSRRGSRPVNGLVLANGGVLTYQNAICLSNHPRRDNNPYPQIDWPRVNHDDQDSGPPVDAEGQGVAAIETYTVEYDRENQLALGHVVCRLSSNGHRVIANHADAMTLQQLASRSEEPIGRIGFVRKCEGVGGRNVFTFTRVGKL